MKKTFILPILFLAAASISFGQSTAVVTKTHAKDNYSIGYPENWELDTSGRMGSSFFLFSETSSTQDTFKENINLIVQDITGLDIDLDKYVEISSEQIKTMIPEGTILESTRKNKEGITYHSMIFTGKQQPYSLKFEQRYWIKNNTAYVLTLTCEKEQFDAYIEIGRKILDSFKIQ